MRVNSGREDNAECLRETCIRDDEITVRTLIANIAKAFGFVCGKVEGVKHLFSVTSELFTKEHFRVCKDHLVVLMENRVTSHPDA
jgi:hypothetical protein